MRFPQAISNRKKGSTAASAARSSGTTIKTLSGSRRAMRARATRGCTLTTPLERTRALASPDSEPCASAKKVRLACLRASPMYRMLRAATSTTEVMVGRPCEGRPMWAPAAAPHRFLQPKRRARRGATLRSQPADPLPRERMRTATRVFFCRPAKPVRNLLPSQSTAARPEETGIHGLACYRMCRSIRSSLQREAPPAGENARCATEQE
jgi:hypothetical protein